ncbi:hypothetical protein [Myxococcus sp. AB025B]|uniref:hypothetical protein n=1 Tax=Myxococcus TaxID=32 RepID=UPI001143241D|nr:hypothetical protein [Myxococcus sp. AB025B]
MKTLRSALLCLVTLSTFAACGVDSIDQASPETLESLGSVSQQAVLPPPPIPNYCPGTTIPGTPWVIPTAPTALSSIPNGTPMYPNSASLLSAYTVIVTDPNNANAFYAFGFDVRAQRLIFWVSGAKTELRRLNSQLATDITVLETSSGIDLGFTWGSSGQVGGPLIPRPGVAEGAWKVAFNNWAQLDNYLISPPAPGTAPVQ